MPFPDLIILSDVRDQIPILSTNLIPFNSDAVGSMSIVRLAHCPHPLRTQHEDVNEGDRFIMGFVLRLLHSPTFPVYMFVFKDLF